MNIRNLLILISLFIINSCLFSTTVIKGKGDIVLRQAEYHNLKGWEKDNHAKALKSLINSCHKFALLPASHQIGNQIGDIRVRDFRDICEIGNTVKGMNSNQARNFFEHWFVPFEVSNKFYNKKGLFTGYYEPELHGSLKKTETYKYPVYSLPRNLKNKPYFTREQIENGALSRKRLEIAYVDDFVDLYFMHIQGSGKIILNDGAVMNLSYAGRNNHPYSSIGKYILKNKLMKKDGIGLNIRSWLKSNPEKASEIFNINNSYIFFKKRDKEYVVGAQGVKLTPERSLAIDNKIMPYGFPFWVETTLQEQYKAKEPYQKLLISQDTGSAIKGVTRGDIFFGSGKKAEKMAIGMNAKGKYYILLPFNVVNKFTNDNLKN